VQGSLLDPYEQWWRVFPRTTVTGGAGVHAPPHKTWKPGGSGSVSSPLPFSAGGDNAVTCKTPKTQQASLFLSLDLFLPLSDLLLSFFRWQIRCEGEATVLGRGGVQALLEEEGGPIWVLWAPLCRVCSLTRRGRPLGRLRDERSLVRGRPT
jgi:hypothetical protein